MYMCSIWVVGTVLDLELHQVFIEVLDVQVLRVRKGTVTTEFLSSILASFHLEIGTRLEAISCVKLSVHGGYP